MSPGAAAAHTAQRWAEPEPGRPGRRRAEPGRARPDRTPRVRHRPEQGRRTPWTQPSHTPYLPGLDRTRVRSDGQDCSASSNTCASFPRKAPSNAVVRQRPHRGFRGPAGGSAPVGAGPFRGPVGQLRRVSPRLADHTAAGNIGDADDGEAVVEVHPRIFMSASGSPASGPASRRRTTSAAGPTDSFARLRAPNRQR